MDVGLRRLGKSESFLLIPFLLTALRLGARLSCFPALLPQLWTRITGQN